MDLQKVVIVSLEYNPKIFGFFKKGRSTLSFSQYAYLSGCSGVVSISICLLIVESEIHVHSYTYMFLSNANWAASWQNHQNGMRAQRRLRSALASAQSESSLSAWRKLGSLANHWAHSKDSDQPGHPSEDWSEWADTQANLSLRWAHSHFVGFVTCSLFIYLILHGKIYYWKMKASWNKNVIHAYKILKSFIFPTILTLLMTFYMNNSIIIIWRN